MEDTAGGATWTDSLASNGSDFGSSYLSCTGKITFSASGSTTNWSVTTVYHNPFQHTAGTISYGSPYDLVVYLNSGAFAIEQAWQSQPGTSGAISYEPTPPGSETKTYNQTNCTISTTTIYPLVSASALVGQSISATTSNMVSGAFWTPATRTYTLSEEIKRETVEQEIISVDLASCPTGNWINTPASATSTFSGNSVSVTKVGYQITLPQTQPGITYLLTWKILVYDSSGNYSGEELATATLTGTGGEVSTGELILLPPLNVGGSKTVEENSLKIEAVSADGGGGGCCGGGNSAPGQGAPKLGSIAVDFGLGKGRFGLGGGQLYLHQESLVYSSSTPASLNFVGDTNLFEILSASGSIRQVLGAQALADVLTLNPYAYEIRFYSITNVGAKTGGFYSVSNSPHTIWTVLNPDGATATNRLQVIELRNNKAITNEYQWAATNETWTYISGNGLRTQTKAILWDATNKIRSEVRKTFTGASVLVGQEVRKYKLYPFGLALNEIRIGSSGEEITTTNTYLSNNTSPLLDTVTRSDGSWDAYTYDTQGRVLINYFSSFSNQVPTKSQSLCSYSQYGYALNSGSGDDGSATNSEPRTTYHAFAGSQVSRDFLVRRPDERIEATGQNVSVAWNTAGNLFTTNRYYTNGAFSGYLKTIFRPDGTASVYAYQTNASLKIITVLDGQPDPSNSSNILDGTKSLTFVGLAGQTYSNVVYAVPQTNVILSQEIYSNFDDLFRPGRITYLDGTFKQITYDCCGIESEIDRDGTRTDYTYDDLKRRQTVTRNGITTTYYYDGMGRVLSTTRKGTDNSIITLESSSYDSAGRLLGQTNALGKVTTFSETVVSNQTLKVTTLPDSGTITNLHARDGSLLEVSGTAAAPLRYQYGVLTGSEPRRFTVEIRLDASGSTNEWVKTYTDPVGRTYKREYAAAGAPYPSETSTYNAKGLLTNQVDADGIITLYRYNAKAEREYTILDTNRNYTIDYTGSDRISRTVNDIITNGSGLVVQRTQTYLWRTNSSAVSNLVSTAEVSVDGLRSWNTVWNNGTAITSQSRTVYDAANGYRYLTNIAPDNSYSVAITRYGTNVSQTAFDSTGAQLAQTTFGYDAHGRQNTVTDARTGTMTSTFNDADQVTSVTTPDPGTGAQVTSMYYDDMGRVWKTTLPDNTSVTNEYFLTGQLKKTYGSRTYPVEYAYDAQGRMKTMKTWQNFAANSGTATTTWNYDQYRGWLTNKTYDGGAAGPTYTYTAAGRLGTRAWARGITTSYNYNNAGDLNTVYYSDGTPGVTNAYNRLGFQTAYTNGATVCSFTYNDVGLLSNESYLSGPLAGLIITNGYDSLLRRTALALSNQPTTLVQFGYDNASRLSAVTNGVNTVNYGYLANSPLVNAHTFKQSGTTRMTVTNRYDNLNRLTGKSSTASAGAAFNFDYAYNSASQRTAVTNLDSSRWSFGYDNLGQVTSGKKYWSDATPVAGQQFEYAFDDIGNRKSASAGGDQSGLNLRQGSYTNNLLNQTTSRGVPGYVHIIGSASNTATVTVNNQPTYRKGDYFRAEMGVANGSGPVQAWFTNIAVLNSGTNADIVASSIGNVLVAPAIEAIGYDLDGNITNDGRWVFQWDAENRVTNIESQATVPLAAKRKIALQYDYAGRPVRRTEYDGSSGSYSSVLEDVRFVNDGWHCLAELNATNNALLRSYVWGLDLSGTTTGAGGVGGLVAINTATNGTHFYAYDGNGNVAGLVSAADGSESVRYEYEPFGALLRSTGVMASENAYGFSTKRRDKTTDILHYEFRIYLTCIGTWGSRDPIEEQGGMNLYGFGNNDSVSGIDPLGLSFGITLGFRARMESEGDLGPNRPYLPKLGNPQGDLYNNALDIFEAWRDGLLPTDGYFGSDSKLTKSLMESPGVLEARSAMLNRIIGEMCKGNSGEVKFTQPIIGEWSKVRTVLSTWDISRQVIGGFGGEVTFYGKREIYDRMNRCGDCCRLEGYMVFNIKNVMGKESYNRHLQWLGFKPTPNKTTPGPQRNYTMHFNWEEHVEASGCPDAH